MISRLACNMLSVGLAFTVCLAAAADQPAQHSSEPAEKASLASNNVPNAEPPAAPGEELEAPLPPMRRGDILMARKMYREAIESYSEAIRDVAVMYNKIGIAYHQLMDFDYALEYYEKALEVDPSYAEAINNIGTVYYAQKRHKKAIKCYQEALEHAPYSASIYSNLGTAHFARKKYDEAFAAYQKALELDPQVFEHRNTAGSLLQERSVAERAKFHFYLAKTYAKAGMVDQALIYIRRALEEGFDDRERFYRDKEFEVLQENEEFQQLMAMEPRVL